MNIKALESVALSVRSLSMDAIQKANSGHPGLPLGCAELAAVLYGEVLKHNPKDSKWADRDRFILSAGHGSMLDYSILHLSGYDISLDDIKNFRQLHSRCPGHPEYGMTDGIEATTGPLGQGIAMAVGFAVAESMLAAKFNTKEHTIVDHYTYTLMGEGCLMEGISSEASSFAGSMKLGKLIAFYDKNLISIDGSTNCTFTEDVKKRYEAYGWQVLEGSMYDMENIAKLVQSAKAETGKPSLIILESVIGKGAPTVEGKAAAHGAPIGKDGIANAKQALGLKPEETFFVSQEAYNFFNEKAEEFANTQKVWENTFTEWKKANPELAKEWDEAFSTKPAEFTLPDYNIGDSLATRNASGAALLEISKVYKNIVGGSADLQGPNCAKIDAIDYTPDTRSGRYIRWGIREFAMGAISNGIQLHGGFRTFNATFMIFADYYKPAMRLSALMKLPVISILTHDSIYVGEDGPTHQPIETLASLRCIPNVQVLRPGDAQETNIAWKLAMESTDKPVVIALTRQNLTVYEKDDSDWKNTARRGAYIVQKSGETPDVTIIATGSEVQLALEASKLAANKNVRVVSIMDRELFASQDDAFKNSIIGKDSRVVVAEAGSRFGWEGFVASNQDLFCIDRFGESAPAQTVAKSLGFTAENLAKIVDRT